MLALSRYFSFWCSASGGSREAPSVFARDYVRATAAASTSTPPYERIEVHAVSIEETIDGHA
jgi:hypothetical protein